jgi:hypothetical protein
MKSGLRLIAIASVLLCACSKAGEKSGKVTQEQEFNGNRKRDSVSVYELQSSYGALSLDSLIGKRRFTSDWQSALAGKRVLLLASVEDVVTEGTELRLTACSLDEPMRHNAVIYFATTMAGILQGVW